MNKMDKILLLIFITATAFTILVMVTTWNDHAVPETFCCAVIGALMGECGIMGWIKNTKEKQTDWQREDTTHERDRQEKKEDNTNEL